MCSSDLQLMSRADRQMHGLDKSDFFFGVINKIGYRRNIGRVVIEPRFKSEFRKQSRGLFSENDETSLTELASALFRVPVLKVTMLQAGIEYMYFNDLEDDSMDFNSLVGAVQFSNESDYLGYRLRALVGWSLERRDFSGQKARLTSQSFITIFAGLN